MTVLLKSKPIAPSMAWKLNRAGFKPLFNVFKIKTATFVLASLLIASPLAVASDSYSGPKLYRYKNDHGVLELNHTLPAEISQKGYDIVTPSGRLIKRVEPALSDAEADALAKAKSEAEKLALWDSDLKRRYSTPADIESAKSRKLDQIDTSILIIQGNLGTLEKLLTEQQKKAADIERRGRDLPESIEVNIKNLELEIEASKEQIAIRQEQYKQTAAKYDRDIERFKEITKDRRS